MLKYAVSESGWSMREVARRCTSSGVNLSQGYLSRLINDSIPPASDPINKALGKVLSPVSNIDPDALYIEAYKERIPSDVLTRLLSR